MGTFPKIRRIKSPEERAAVIAAARADNDALDFPSHVLLRDGEIVGGISAGVVPLVMVWNRTDRIGARESAVLPTFYDALMEERNFGKFLIACNARSPYRPHMDRLGYRHVWDTALFMGGANA